MYQGRRSIFNINILIIGINLRHCSTGSRAATAKDGSFILKRKMQNRLCYRLMLVLKL